MVQITQLTSERKAEQEGDENVTKDERENWIINIENTASTISSQLGSAVVDGVFQRYGAHSVDDLNPCDLPDVFSELYAIEADLR